MKRYEDCAGRDMLDFGPGFFHFGQSGKFEIESSERVGDEWVLTGYGWDNMGGLNARTSGLITRKIKALPKQQ